jgi:hypothetical protein
LAHAAIQGLSWRHDTQHNGTKHDDIQYNDTRNNDIQHNIKQNTTLNIMAESCYAEYHLS